MIKETAYYRQANLVLDVLPLLASEKHFALKGGTAINFFIRDLPRLSVDIDLTWLPVEDRETTMKNIDHALKELSEQIEQKIPMVGIIPRLSRGTERTSGLVIRSENASIKIEPNLIARGSVYPAEKRILVKKAQDIFEKAIQVQTLSFADVYAGKICAALDRQHPRDLFDIKLLLENEGFTDELRQAFIVYLISHNRPMLELLNPNLIDIKEIFELELKEMTFEPITFEELLIARKSLIGIINKSLTDSEKRFLVSLKAGEPDWDSFGSEHLQQLPAVRWKLHNIRKMDRKRHKEALSKLADFLDVE